MGSSQDRYFVEKTNTQEVDAARILNERGLDIVRSSSFVITKMLITDSISTIDMRFSKPERRQFEMTNYVKNGTRDNLLFI